MIRRRVDDPHVIDTQSKFQCFSNRPVLSRGHGHTEIVIVNIWTVNYVEVRCEFWSGIEESRGIFDAWFNWWTLGRRRLHRYWNSEEPPSIIIIVMKRCRRYNKWNSNKFESHSYTSTMCAIYIEYLVLLQLWEFIEIQPFTKTLSRTLIVQIEFLLSGM